MRYGTKAPGSTTLSSKIALLIGEDLFYIVGEVCNRVRLDESNLAKL